MKRFVSLVLSVCFLFSINTVSYAANTSSRKASNPVIQSMNDKYHVDFSGMSIDELNKFIDKMKDEDQTRAWWWVRCTEERADIVSCYGSGCCSLQGTSAQSGCGRRSTS